jgi:Protein of unknwon function (DUF3310)
MATSKSILRQNYEAGVKPRIRMQAGYPEMDRPANATQVGGTHYKDKGLQPWDAIAAWDCGFLDGNVIKYVVRYRSKGGVEDLKKARHYLDKLIELEGLK